MFNKMQVFVEEANSNGEVEVFTCMDGYRLLKMESQFVVWHKQFSEKGDVKLLIPLSDLSLDIEGDVYVVDTINVRVLEWI